MSEQATEEMKKCDQQRCDNPATGRMFWPNNEPLLVCDDCKQKALAVANSMGFFLHIDPL